jgi:histidine triad (HIT) family protein
MSACIFCRIIAGTIPAKIAFQDDRVLAFHDVNPQAPVHVLVVPKRHMESLQDMTREDGDLLAHLLMVCKQIGSDQGLRDSGYRVVTNVGRDAGQSVFHLHLHLLGGRHMSWPPG